LLMIIKKNTAAAFCTIIEHKKDEAIRALQSKLLESDWAESSLVMKEDDGELVFAPESVPNPVLA
jgi:hypothetical protein